MIYNEHMPGHELGRFYIYNYMCIYIYWIISILIIFIFQKFKCKIYISNIEIKLLKLSLTF